MMDARLTKDDQLRLAREGALFVASCPAFARGDVAVVVCRGGSCGVVADDFLPITCSPLTY
ncbi:MAG: hypothetical protein AB8H86_18560 [Polyangiales bacterium]